MSPLKTKSRQSAPQQPLTRQPVRVGLRVVALMLMVGTVAWAAQAIGAPTPETPTSETPVVESAGARSAGTNQPQQQITFNEHIRPILSENCFHCHGPDPEGRGADLRLDQREAAVDYGAIVPEDPDNSVMVERINSNDADILMPPPRSHKSLTAEQKQTIADWIGQGAEYQQHWAFLPIAADANARLTVDHFIDAKLRAKQLKPSGPAPRERWLRRVTLDLTGLPPTLKEIEAFLADDQPVAAERVVDRLLDSPSYGERMAAEWLDVARYSDTYGYQVDRPRFVWPWRDWVIRAFNDNLPYDDFIVQQVAGDLLPDATDEQLLATTFNRLHPQKVEGGSVEEEFRVEYVVDRAHTFSMAFMGLTFECARCHDHKFDPLTQQEFYELNAFFANINEAGLYSYHTPSIPTPTLELPTDQQRSELAKANRAVAAAEQAYAKALAAVRQQGLAGLKHDGTNRLKRPIAAQDFDDDGTDKISAKLVPGVMGNAAQLSGDQGINVGPALFRRWQPFSIALWLQTPDVKDRAVVLHRSLGWTDAASRGYQLLIEEGKLSAALVHFWPGNAINVQTAEPIPTKEWMHVVMTYDGSSRAEGLQLFINGKPAQIMIAQNHLTKQILAGDDKDMTLGQRTRDRGFKHGLVDGIEVYDRQLTTAEIESRAKQQPIDQLLKAAQLAQLPAEQSAALLAQLDPAALAARKKLQEARQKRDELLDQVKEIMVMRELDEPRETHVLDRGVYDARKERVWPGTPAALPSLPQQAPRNRLGLAQWLTDPGHPLTARVAVNRYWQLLFGRGLVVTTEDFGSQGSPPTHPQLLDWLSRRFIDSGWDVKQLLKTIVLSDAYRRDSAGVGDSEQRDAENIWLARGPAAPLTAEMIRDSSLAVSGLLSPKVGGPPAKPYELAVSFKPMKTDKGEGLYRRSLYTYWQRTAPAPVMLVLDASTRDVCRVRRERTSSPLQAMVLLNGPQYVEAAQGAAARVLAGLPTASTVNQQLKRLFRLLTAREPTKKELVILARLYQKQRDSFAQDTSAVQAYLAIGEFVPEDSTGRAHVAALSIVAQAIMNLDDCLIKR